MNAPTLLRFQLPAEPFGPRLGVQIDEVIYDVTEPIGSVAAWLRGSAGRTADALSELLDAAEHASTSYPFTTFAEQPDAARPWLLAPVDTQEVWAAGVTYSRSRAARQEEAADGGDIYARVYTAERPELFYKSSGPRVVRPWGDVGIRRDATWSVPEPELGLVLNPALEIVGLVAGNDMSSRDIEGANPLYLPQAKTYTASCSLGPGLLLQPLGQTWPDAALNLIINRAGQELFRGDTHTDEIRREPQELVEFLGRSQSFPDGVVLLTGTGIVPPDDISLEIGDEIIITITGIGRLVNRVIQV